MVRPVTSPDPAWRSSGSLESAEPVWKKKKPRTFKGLSTLKPSTLCRLFLRLGLPSTLICHENGARSSNRRDLKTPAFRFRMDGKIFNNGAFWNDDLTIIIRYPCIWCVFRVKSAPFWNSTGEVWSGPHTTPWRQFGFTKSAELMHGQNVKESWKS